MKDVIVIGGGASGLVSAIYAAKAGAKVCLLEKNNTCGKKILITGNGRCNYWNSDQSITHYHTRNKEVLEKILQKDYSKEVLSFFNSIGIIPRIKDGYFYPISNQAVSIQTALIKEAQINHVEILTNTEVISIKKENHIFKINTNNGIFTSKKIILATGSKAAPKTGSTGSGYDIAKSLGHSLITPLPALVQLKADAPYLKEWHGIRADVKISLFENNKYIDSKVGEIQLTDYGISGICTLCLSGRAALSLSKKKKTEVKINFLHQLNIHNKNSFLNFMEERNKTVKNRNIADLLDGILNYKLVNLILKQSKIGREDNWNNLSNDKKYLLGDNLTNFTLTITGTNSFDQAQVTTGGIPLTEINPNTLESTKTKGLYLTGELLDVDGDCGGYNLGFAWISGIIVGSNIKGEGND